MAKRVRTPDLVDSSITSDQIQDGSITITDIKIATDTDAVTAETIPYERTNPAISIHDVVDPLTANTFNLRYDSTAATGTTTDFVLTGTVNTTVMYQVFLNGQIMDEYIDYSLVTGDTTVRFAFIPETGLKIKIIYQPV